MIHFDPSWWHDFKINGEDEIAVFDSIAKPSKILLGIYPCSPNWPAIRKQDFDWLTFNFQRTSAHDSSFWFKPQTFGYRLDNDWCVWRKPDPPELISIVMLALAHGAKGIIFEWFNSYSQDAGVCDAVVYIKCLVDENGNPLSLYTTVKDTLVPRLKGKLGTTLMDLDYTGNFIQSYYEIPTQNPLPDPQTVEYLTLGYGNYTAHNMFWHCRFFNQKNHLDNKYFLLVNLYQGAESKTIKVRVTPPVQGYENTSSEMWRDISMKRFKMKLLANNL